MGQDLRNPKLKSQEVSSPKFGDCFSSKITGDLRIVLRDKDGYVEITGLIDTGGHTGNKTGYQAKKITITTPTNKSTLHFFLTFQ